MLLSFDEVLNMRERDMLAFLDLRFPEASGLIDYKRSIYGPTKTKDECHAEFLRDITAFANAKGGHIIIGVDDPTKAQKVSDAVVGIDDGIAVAQALESVAARCVDPRIIGLRVIPLPLVSGKQLLLVHIPPGESRPHRVHHDQSKTWGFFVRHGESKRMMNTQEIRDAAISSLTGEQQAKSYADQIVGESEDDLYSGGPVFFMQAVPLIRMDPIWNTTATEFQEVMFGTNRRDSTGRSYELTTNIGRSPTLHGIRSVDDRVNPSVIMEIHRNGYVSAAMKLGQGDDGKPRMLFQEHGEIFLAFADLCRDAVTASKSEAPYLMRAVLHNTKGTMMQTGESFPLKSQVCKRDAIKLPDLRRQTAEDFRNAVGPWLDILVNAYGLDVPRKKQQK